MSDPKTTRRSPPIRRNRGVTDAECYLQSLCDRTFLTLWSYSGVFRDQGLKGSTKEGKEVADLLVVFGDDIIVFSDKDCDFPDSGNISTDWQRWFKRAVWKSAQQAWGAERWIREHPSRLFLDPACTEPFPLDLPPSERMRFHHVVVAHNAAKQCCQYFGGGSGSFIINSRVIGEDHFAGPGPARGPFVVGDLDPKKGFVHVFEDTSLRIVLQTLDTVADFTAYLRKKEALLRSGKPVMATGEEDLLAQYLAKLDPDGTHGFSFLEDYDGFSVTEGVWDSFVQAPQRRAQVEADRISYTWDRLIETFNGHIIKGRYYQSTDPAPRVREKTVRFLAAEPRLRRRMLSKALVDLIKSYPIERENWKSVRVVCPNFPGEPHYLFLVLGRSTYAESYEEYREMRGALLEAYSIALKYKCPDALDIIGVATEPYSIEGHSEDALRLDTRDWTPEMQADGAYFCEEVGLLSEITTQGGHEDEYPEPPVLLKNPRNKPCPCGSGRKYKHCHGRR